MAACALVVSRPTMSSIAVSWPEGEEEEEEE
jgi:hypothetical protein